MNGNGEFIYMYEILDPGIIEILKYIIPNSIKMHAEMVVAIGQ